MALHGRVNAMSARASARFGRCVGLLPASVTLLAGACGASGAPNGDLPDGSGCPVSTAQGPTPRLLAIQIASPGALALDATSVWFTAYSAGAIGRVHKQDGSGPKPVINGIAFPTGLAVDDAAVYF